MSRRVRHGLGAAGIVAVVWLYFVRGRDDDVPGWALGLAVLVVVVLSVAQDVALHYRSPRVR